MLEGMGVSEGIGIGKALVIKKTERSFAERSLIGAAEEIKRCQSAVMKFISKTKLMADNIALNAGEKEADILLGHIIMVEDPYMQGEIKELLLSGSSAEYAVSCVCDSFISMFSSVDDELTNQRAADVLDIKTSLLAILMNVEEPDLKSVPPGTIIVAGILTPSMTSEISAESIVGIVTESGGRSSHSSIIARALGIPAVVGAKGAQESIENGDTLIVDGGEGKVMLSPDEKLLAQYAEKRLEYIRLHDELNKYRNVPTVTADGKKKLLLCNIASSQDALTAKNSTAEGIGLFRTELMFLQKNRLPTEEEQYAEYKRIALTFRQKPVKIRTLDIGGDKPIPYLNIKKEDNPYLGSRAIRYCMKQREIFMSQIKAILRASAYGKIKLMIPLVTCVDEIQAVKEIIKAAKSELVAEGRCFDENIELGIMMETPAAAVMADAFAEEVDFFSIGTNDLTQYIMAVDRGNEDMAYLYSPLNPAVLRTVRHIIEAGHNAGIPVEMCGEAACDPLMIPLLIAFGLDEYSVSSGSVLKTRRIISMWSKTHAQSVADSVMKLKTAGEISAFLKNENERLGIAL